MSSVFCERLSDTLTFPHEAHEPKTATSLISAVLSISSACATHVAERQSSVNIAIALYTYVS